MGETHSVEEFCWKKVRKQSYCSLGNYDTIRHRSLFSPLSRVRLVTFAANHVRDLIYAGHMVDKTKYVIAVLRSISNFIVLQNDRLFNYIYKKKDRKENRKNEPYPRCSESFTFRCSALNALSRNYDICISYGKVQPTNFDSKPKTERKDQLYIQRKEIS